MKTVHIASSRMEEIGKRCEDWATNNLPDGWEISPCQEDCDVFISVLYDTLITKGFIDLRRCYNFHPGILPDYRGAGVYSWVLINQELETGITLHEIDYNLDSGPIIKISSMEIQKESTAETLFTSCMELLFNLFKSQFENLLTGDYTVVTNEGGKLYTRKDLESAKDISRIVRAFSFTGKESIFWLDSNGKKHHVNYE